MPKMTSLSSTQRCHTSIWAIHTSFGTCTKTLKRPQPEKDRLVGQSYIKFSLRNLSYNGLPIVRVSGILPSHVFQFNLTSILGNLVHNNNLWRKIADTVFHGKESMNFPKRKNFFSFGLPFRELTYPIKITFEDDFPFPKVGYVNSLQSIICKWANFSFFLQKRSLNLQPASGAVKVTEMKNWLICRKRPPKNSEKRHLSTGFFNRG